MVEREEILELPLPARNVTNLIMSAGAAVQVDQSPSWGMATGVNIAVAGGQRFGVAYLLDGAEHTNRFDQTGMPMPFPDSLQEFRVSTSTQEAGTARASGASVNAVTRAGTNQFHGDLFWFGRHAAFNAQKADATRDDGLKRNQPGFTIGGPVLSNRLFFFQAYQSTIARSRAVGHAVDRPDGGDARRRLVGVQPVLSPDLARHRFRRRQRQPGTLQRGGACNWRGGCRSRRTPAARCAGATPSSGTTSRSISRVDFTQTAKHSLFGRYMGTLHDQTVPFAKDPSNLLSTTSSGFKDRHHSLVLGNTWVINSNAVNSIRVAYNRLDGEQDRRALLQPRGGRHRPMDVGAGALRAHGPRLLHAWAAGRRPSARCGRTSCRSATTSTSRAATTSSRSAACSAQSDVVSLAHTRGVGGLTFSANTTGNALADFMLGAVTEMRQSMPSTLSPAQKYVALYAQDTWRATPKLTVNVGVRWEPFMPMVWRENEYGGIRVYNFDVERLQGGPEERGVPHRARRVHLPEPEPGRLRPGRLRGPLGASPPSGTSSRRAWAPPRTRPARDARRSARATASPTT